MRARAVIGANFGDEGKGLVTDYLCAKEGAGMVVRFNGGAQAGHTVVTPDGHRHVFHHFGSGTFAGVPTYLSEFFICNPIAFFRELDELVRLPVKIPQVFAHPKCLVTTFADMVINQRLEDSRGDKRHGSCGLGIFETHERSKLPHLKITMADLWNGMNLEKQLEEMCDKYARFRGVGKIDMPGAAAVFIRQCVMFADMVTPLGIAQCRDPVFEGAQGLLLDQHNKAYFPHLTRSNTGLRNVRELCKTAGIDKIDPYYVTRTYLTRHGAGPLPGEDLKLSYEDNTNVDHDYQGALRFAPLNIPELAHRVRRDCPDMPFTMVVTHRDQCDAFATELCFAGPTREDVVSQKMAISA